MKGRLMLQELQSRRKEFVQSEQVIFLPVYYTMFM